MKILGIMVFLMIGGVVGNALLSIVGQDAAQQAIQSELPWIADYTDALIIGIGVLLAVIVLAIPPMILNKERGVSDELGTFEKIGITTCIAGAVGSICFLFTVGYVGMTATL